MTESPFQTTAATRWTWREIAGAVGFAVVLGELFITFFGVL